MESKPWGIITATFLVFMFAWTSVVSFNNHALSTAVGGLVFLALYMVVEKAIKHFRGRD